MDRARDPQTEQQLRFLLELVEENASIAGDVVPMRYGLWAIHGVIPVDGDVLMAEFGTYDDARTVLDQISDAPARLPEL